MFNHNIMNDNINQMNDIISRIHNALQPWGRHEGRRVWRPTNTHKTSNIYIYIYIYTHIYR